MKLKEIINEMAMGSISGGSGDTLSSLKKDPRGTIARVLNGLKPGAAPQKQNAAHILDYVKKEKPNFGQIHPDVMRDINTLKMAFLKVVKYDSGVKNVSQVGRNVSK